jgi:hypothetical protein
MCFVLQYTLSTYYVNMFFLYCKYSIFSMF